MLNLLKKINRVLNERNLDLAIIKEDIDEFAEVDILYIEFFVGKYEINIYESQDNKNKFELHQFDNTKTDSMEYIENISRKDVINEILEIMIELRID